MLFHGWPFCLYACHVTVQVKKAYHMSSLTSIMAIDKKSSCGMRHSPRKMDKDWCRSQAAAKTA